MRGELMENEFLIREFEEFDEKLPQVAKIIVRRGINFELLTEEIEDENEDEETSEQFRERWEVFQSVYAIFREMVECTSEMTGDEFEYYVDMLLTACELVVLVSDGLACEEENGKFFLTPKGKSLYDLKSREFDSD